MRDFKKYDVWIKPHDLALMGYKEIAPLFPKTEQFTLINQMKRAAYCVPFNNAEECGRNTDKDFVHF
ncbi:MAG: four helix bundle protein, partial [Bacteroidetes bacterium]|nr:four helix bundle protein [Bacteroidota bacterium]